MAGYVNKVLDVIKSNWGNEAVIAVKRVLSYKGNALRNQFDARTNIALAQKAIVNQNLDDADIVNEAFALFAQQGLVCGDTLLTRIVRPGDVMIMGRTESLDDDADGHGGLAALLAAPEPEPEPEPDFESEFGFWADGVDERAKLAKFLANRGGIGLDAVKEKLFNVVRLSAEIARRAALRRRGKRSSANAFVDLAYNSELAVGISQYAFRRLLDGRIAQKSRDEIVRFSKAVVPDDEVEQHRRCAIAMLAPLCRSARALCELMQLPAERVFALLLQTGASLRNRYFDGVPQAGRLQRLTAAVITSFVSVGAADMRGLDVFTGIVRAGRGSKVVYLPQPVRRHKHKQKNTAAAVPRQLELFVLAA